MKPTHLLMTLLVTANVLLWAVGFTVYDEPNYESECLLGLLMANAGLLAIWLVLGRTSAPRRLIVVSVGVLLFFGAVGNWRAEFYAFPVLLLIGILCVSVPLLAMRMLGLRLICLDDPEPETASEQSGFQFSLGTMFAWTTALAITLSVFTTIGFQPIAEFMRVLERAEPYIVVPCIFSPLLWLWVVLIGMQTMKPRTIGFVLISLFAPIICLMPVGGFNVKLAVGIFALQGAVLLLSLIVCRVAGYRIVWQRRSRHAEHDLRSGGSDDFPD